MDGHLGSVSVKLRQSATAEEVIALFQTWQPPQIRA
jgi:hypothetical protein